MIVRSRLCCCTCFYVHALCSTRTPFLRQETVSLLLSSTPPLFCLALRLRVPSRSVAYYLSLSLFHAGAVVLWYLFDHSACTLPAVTAGVIANVVYSTARMTMCILRKTI